MRVAALVDAEASRGTPLLDALVGAGHEVRELASADDPALATALAGSDLAVGGVRGADSAALRRAAVTAGIPLIDTDADLAGVRAARDELDVAARDAGVPLVLGVSWRTVLGDLLAAVSARHLVHVDEVHVAYTVPDRGGVLAAATPDGRAGLATHLPGPAVARVRGEVVEERLAEHRRLAWFPRPLGPHHAASVPGLEPLWVPSHLEVGTVRTYVAASSMRAELLQAAGNLAGWGPTADRVQRWLARPGVPVTGATRWACVAEVARGETPVRGWANGRDPGAVTTAAVVALGRTLAGRHGVAAGVLAPTQVADPEATLDAIAVGAGMRWSVVVPEGR